MEQCPVGAGNAPMDLKQYSWDPEITVSITIYHSNWILLRVKRDTIQDYPM